MIPAKKYAEHLIRCHYAYSRCDDGKRWNRLEYAIMNAIITVRTILRCNPIAFSSNGTMYQTDGYWKDVMREITNYKNNGKKITHISKVAKQHRLKNPYK